MEDSVEELLAISYWLMVLQRELWVNLNRELITLGINHSMETANG